MVFRLTLAALVLVFVSVPVLADTVIVDENFDQYGVDPNDPNSNPDQAAFEAVWAGTNGILVAPAVNPDPNNPNNDPPNLQGRGVNILTGINEYVGLPGTVVPSATEAVRVSGDFFDSLTATSGNRRASIGLRSTSPSNIVELGFWNANTYDPTVADPNGDPILDQPSTGYAYRVVLFGTLGGNLLFEPNWQYFPLDPSLDFNDNGSVNASDIGSATPADEPVPI